MMFLSTLTTHSISAGGEALRFRHNNQPFDAVLDPTLWPKALEELVRFVCGSAGGLYWQNPVSKTGNAPYTFGP